MLLIQSTIVKGFLEQSFNSWFTPKEKTGKEKKTVIEIMYSQEEN